MKARLSQLVVLVSSAWHITWAAYIQQKPCPDEETPYLIDGLSASVYQSSPEIRVDLDVIGLRLANGSGSSLSEVDIVVEINTSSLWGESFHQLFPETSSFVSPSQNPQTAYSAYRHYRCSYTLEHPSLIDDYLLEIRIQQNKDKKLLACSYGYLTPEVDNSLSAASFWVPVMTVALLVAGSAASRASPWAVSLQDTSIAAIFERYSTSKVADCLAYGQFVFFTGALTLQFPGFVRPITSFSSWSTLMFPGGPITGDSLYKGVFDGVYEVNGTFDGGTAGLEIVSQITGSPPTDWTWVNIISLTCMLLASLTLIFHLGPTIPWTRLAFSSRTMRQIRRTETPGVKSTIYTVLRLFFSYFMTPVTAWTSYQITKAHLLPVYHTIISAVVLLLIPLAFWWSLRQTPARQLGYFIVMDASGAYKEGEIRPRDQDQLVLGIFIFMYLRGCIIGGLQIAGLPQLLALMVCEALQLLIVVLLRQVNALINTTSNLLCVVRLFTWLLCIGFLPGVAGHIPRSILGVILLSIHVAVLTFVFILPSTFKLGRSAIRMMFKEPAGEQTLELPQISSSAGRRLSGNSNGLRATSRVQHWLDMVSPSDRASMQSINDDSVSTCTTLVERPLSGGEIQLGPAEAANENPPVITIIGNTASGDIPNFSRPLSTATRIAPH